uniref:Uncharacterized protein n=1 Tax=Arundo donax TaxID=35708 RepID=A0A0A8XYC8_ARUDO
MLPLHCCWITLARSYLLNPPFLRDVQCLFFTYDLGTAV